MKLLLTSAGLTNQSIIDALHELVDKPFEELSLAYVPTAAMAENSDKQWLIRNLVQCQERNFKQIDIVDISAVPKENWLPRIEEADLLFLGGGNTFYLMYWVKKSGLEVLLPELLKSKIYIGLSAGSCMMGPVVDSPFQAVFFADEENDHEVTRGLDIVPFHIIPHLNSPKFDILAKETEEIAKQVTEPVYAIDDNSALKIVDGNVTVVSEGEWELFNG